MGNRSIVGPQGPQGEPVGVISFADFYALMPPDNAETVAVGADVSFPQDRASGGTGITRLSESSFNLEEKVSIKSYFK